MIKKVIIFFLLFIFNIQMLVVAKNENNIKEIQKIEKVTIPYENKTFMFMNKFLEGIKNFYLHFDSAIMTYNSKDFLEDYNYKKFTSYYRKEINFIKLLEKKEGVILTDREKKSFFKFIGDGKAINEIKNKKKDNLTKIIFLRKGNNNITYKVIFNQLKGSLSIMEMIDGKFQTVYGGKSEIPIEASIYDVKMIYSLSNNTPYLIVKFFTMNGIDISIMSLSFNNGKINLVSDVTGVYVNNNNNYFAYKQLECDQKLRYFNIVDNKLFGYCLSKLDSTKSLKYILIK